MNIQRWLRTRWIRQMLRSTTGQRLFLSPAYWNESFPQRHPERMAVGLLPDGTIRDLVAHALGEETEHARLFAEHLQALGQGPLALPPGLVFVEELYSSGLRPSAARLQAGHPLTNDEAIQYLATSICLEQVAMAQLQDALAACRWEGTQQIATTIKRILTDEADHADPAAATTAGQPLLAAAQRLAQRLQRQVNHIDRQVGTRIVAYGLTQLWGPTSWWRRGFWSAIVKMGSDPFSFIKARGQGKGLVGVMPVASSNDWHAQRGRG